MGFLKFIDKINHGRPGKIFPVVVIVLLGAIAYYYVQQDRKRLFNNKIFTTGEIYDYTMVARSSATNFICRFYVGGVKYSFSQVVREVNRAYADDFVGKTFPVIYEKENPSNCELLLVPENFQQINMPFPDSLNWVRKCH
ncbi:hypothetical protein SIO70_15700 [Chitinophaga sancti]|uniref:hypothetical protein n=1 Tax=Chitinophaga sancti TaxID=1004 RepID=UPI002A75467B|nr:hypothetical protein [Chitinophaga sancti]WPQ66305.1 hypothetical protein SIO70_15700 [Chitinophaga sancti]